jgi:NADH-quinone oxidoreductase subunit M
VFAAIGTVLTAAYFLWMLQRMNLGRPLDRWRDEPLQDVMTVEWVAWTPLLVLVLALGLFPRLLFGVQNDAVARLLTFVTG